MRPRRGKTTWVVIESEDGSFELLRNGRPLASGLSERALRHRMKKSMTPADRILREEPDGYRRPARLSDFTGHLRKV
jgi:hypothetical protein